MQYITRTIRDIYPVWTESDKSLFVDTEVVPTITMREAESVDDLPILTAPLAPDVLIPIETLQPLGPEQSFFNIDSLFLQLWVNGETHCFAVRCSFQPYTYTDSDEEVKTFQTHGIKLDAESQSIAGDTPLHEVVDVRISTCLTVDTVNATLCVTGEPATVTAQEDESAPTDAEVTYAANLIGFTISQILYINRTE